MEPTPRQQRAILLATLLAAAGTACNRNADAVRGPGLPVPLRSVVLRDVQGLWGGHALWAWDEGKVVVQVVGKTPMGRTGLWEKRYERKLTADQWAEIERLIGAHHFLTLEVKDRYGEPDEPRPSITVVTRDGVRRKVAKWAGDEHTDFDSLYAHLRGLCDGVEGQPIYEGPFDWDWRPEGFD